MSIKLTLIKSLLPFNFLLIKGLLKHYIKVGIPRDYHGQKDQGAYEVFSSWNG